MSFGAKWATAMTVLGFTTALVVYLATESLGWAPCWTPWLGDGCQHAGAPEPWTVTAAVSLRVESGALTGR
jgi:hypothetical protein